MALFPVALSDRNYPRTLRISCVVTKIMPKLVDHKVNIMLTLAGESITGVSSITGTVEAVRYVSASGKLAASSVVVGAFIHICVCYQRIVTALDLTNQAY